MTTSLPFSMTIPVGNTGLTDMLREHMFSSPRPPVGVCRDKNYSDPRQSPLFIAFMRLSAHRLLRRLHARSLRQPQSSQHESGLKPLYTRKLSMVAGQEEWWDGSQMWRKKRGDIFKQMYRCKSCDRFSFTDCLFRAIVSMLFSIRENHHGTERYFLHKLWRAD